MRIFKITLWRALAIVGIALAVLCFMLTGIANNFAPMVNKFLHIETSETSGTGDERSQYYTSDYANLDEMYKAKAALLRETAQEGAVLLKNNGGLPVKQGKVTLYGEDNFVLSTNNGGGSMRPGNLRATATTLSAALAFDGLEVNVNPNAAAGSIAAIVVIGRVAGEGTDVSAGELALTSGERSLISRAKSVCDNVVILISGDHPVEIADYADDDGIKAILKFGNAGYRGAYGLADVITGKVNPSGRLVETFAVDTSSAPAMMNFGDNSYTNATRIRASQAKNYVTYNEGIYIDYRYYETRYEDCVTGRGNASSSTGAYASESGWNYAEEVIWPYGYGLSYTSFTQELMGDPVFDDSAHTVTVNVKVTNDGDTAGKDVVQLYVQTPYTAGGPEKSAVQLIGYGKTELIDPHDSKTVTIAADMQSFATYDYEDAKSYVMDAGNYYFAIGDNAHDALNNILAAKGVTALIDENGSAVDGDADKVYVRTLESGDDGYSRSVYTQAAISNAFADADINRWLADSDKVTYLSRSAWDTTYPETMKITATADMISALNDVRKYENGEWNDTKSRAANEEVSYVDITTQSGLAEVVSNKSVVVMRDKPYDDPEWDGYLDNLSVYEMANMTAQGRYYIQSCPSLSFPESTGSDSPIGLNIPYLYYSIDKQTGATVSVDGHMLSDGITDDKISAKDLYQICTLPSPCSLQRSTTSLRAVKATCSARTGCTATRVSIGDSG